MPVHGGDSSCTFLGGRCVLSSTCAKPTTLPLPPADTGKQCGSRRKRERARDQREGDRPLAEQPQGRSAADLPDGVGLALHREHRRAHI